MDFRLAGVFDDESSLRACIAHGTHAEVADPARAQAEDPVVVPSRDGVPGFERGPCTGVILRRGVPTHAFARVDLYGPPRAKRHSARHPVTRAVALGARGPRQLLLEPAGRPAECRMVGHIDCAVATARPRAGQEVRRTNHGLLAAQVSTQRSAAGPSQVRRP
ncbi:hypothetical protein ACFY1B_45535 [Streptomyces mirabilis]|uniref:hypothetical protein n=1 Tax=Streptomyces mirabilis TaxID=68239 RepID=UPI00369A1420